MAVGHCVCLVNCEMGCELGGNRGLIPIVIVIVIGHLQLLVLNTNLTNLTNYYSCHSCYSCSSKNEYLVVAYCYRGGVLSAE